MHRSESTIHRWLVEDHSNASVLTMEFHLAVNMHLMTVSTGGVI